MEHAYIIYTMLVSAICLCLIMPMFIERLIEYFNPQIPALAWNVQGFVVIGVNSKRGGMMYQFDIRLA